MRPFWLFRTNLRQFEYYHKYTDLCRFKTYCHDFYLLQGIWFLENNVFDQVVIWRLSLPGITPEDIIFNINGKLFIQKFVNNFEECFKYNPRPKVTFFRGGFPEYGKLTRMRPEYFGLVLYCGTGRRVYPQHSGMYNKILVEDNRDMNPGCIPFYKTASPQRFKPLGTKKEYDICWPCNFTQMSYKGQEFFVKQVSKSEYLKKLKILHIGNGYNKGKALCEQYNVKNITFEGYASRRRLNMLLNRSKLALITSNMTDGSPRLITEIMASGTPLILRDQTRALKYYRDNTISFNDYNIESKIKKAITNHVALSEKAYKTTKTLTMDVVCKKNIKHWVKQ